MSWIARLSTNVQEIRLVYHPEHASSVGIRLFIEKNYTQIKRLNPRLPFLVRPFTNPGTDSVITARYDYGAEVSRKVNDLSAEEIKEHLRELVELGEHALKADLYPWQESSNKDVDIVDYEATEFELHHC